MHRIITLPPTQGGWGFNQDNTILTVVDFGGDIRVDKLHVRKLTFLMVLKIVLYLQSLMRILLH